MSLLSAPGNVLIKTTLAFEVTTRGIVVHPDVFLSKQVLTQSLAEGEMLRLLKFLEPIHF